MHQSLWFSLLHVLVLVEAACPFMTGEMPASMAKRDKSGGEDDGKVPADDAFLDQFVLNDTDSVMTTDFGTPVDDRTSLKAGQRGPTLLEDFVYRTKLLHFDRERIPERVGE
jgi:catalase